MLRCGLKRLSFLVFVFFVVAPLTLMVWRGIWGLLDEYITTINDEVNITSSTYHPSTGCNFKNKTHPSDDNLQNVHPVHSRKAQYSVFIVFIVGLSLRFAFEVSQHEVGDGIEEILQNFGTLIKPVIYGITYLYITVNTIITVALWRGQWLLLDELTNSMIGGEKKLLWYILLHAWVLCFALMIVVYLRSSISLIACPLGVASDRRAEVYNAPSLHNRTLTDHTFMSFLSDILLSLIVICLSISVWWSCWRLFDDMACFNSSLHTDGLLASVPNQSNILWWSIILGYVFCLTVYCFQFVLKRGPSHVSINGDQAPWYYHLCYYFLTLLGTLGCICIWRGLWGAIDEWTDDIVPDQPRNFITTACIAVILLIILGCFNTTSSRGVRNLQAVIQEHQSSELLFELEYQHPWLRPLCCNTYRNNYRDIDELDTDQTSRSRGNNSNENGTYTSETNDRRLQRRTESPTNRGRNGVLTEMAPIVITD